MSNWRYEQLLVSAGVCAGIVASLFVGIFEQIIIILSGEEYVLLAHSILLLAFIALLFSFFGSIKKATHMSR